MAPATVAATALEALAARAGPVASKATLTWLLAVPHAGKFRPQSFQEVATAGGRLLIRGEVLLASFTSLSQALRCATTLFTVGTDQPGASLEMGLDSLTVPLDAAGNPVGEVLTDLAAITGIADEGQLLVSPRVLGLLSGVSHTRVARLPRPAGLLEVYEVAWRKGQRIGRRRSSTGLVAFLAVAMALIGVLVAREWERVRYDEAMEQRMMVEQPVALPGAATASGAGAADRLDTPAAAPGEAPAPDRVPGSAQAARPRVPTGALTLLTTPEAAVRLRGKALGNTPLFKVPLAVGTHRVELTGPDGKVRLLSVPIRNGETTAMRLKLEELPAR